jgi:hypothetical protein
MDGALFEFAASTGALRFVAGIMMMIGLYNLIRFVEVDNAEVNASHPYGSRWKVGLRDANDVVSSNF